MKHNSCRKALVFVLFASILISFAAFSTFASNPAGVPSDYEYVGQTTRREGGFLGIGVKTYIYESYRETYDTFAFYPSMSVCPQFYHRYNGSAFTLNYSQTVSISSISGVDFSESIGLSVNEDIVGIMISCGRTQSQASGLEVSATGGVAAEIPSTAPTGYYEMVPARTFRRYSIAKFLNSNLQGTPTELYGITGDTFLTVIYKPTSTSYWYVYG